MYILSYSGKPMKKLMLAFLGRFFSWKARHDKHCCLLRYIPSPHFEVKPLEQLDRAEAFLVAAGLVDMFIILPMIDTDGIGGFVWNVWISGTWRMSCAADKWIDFTLTGVWLHKKAGGSYQIFKRTYVKKFVTTCLTTRWRHRLHWVPGEPKNIVLLRLVRALKAFRAMRMVRTFWPECGAEFPSVSGGCGSDCHFGHIFGVFFPLPNRNRHGWHGGVSKIRGWWS